VHDGSALLRIESVEEGIYREGSHVLSVGGSADKAGNARRPGRRAPTMIICDFQGKQGQAGFVMAHNPIGAYIPLCLRGVPVMGYSGRLDR
jgi:hypothetical protein